MKEYQLQYNRGIAKELQLRNQMDNTQIELHSTKSTERKRILANEIKESIQEREKVLNGLNKMIQRYKIKGDNVLEGFSEI